MRNLWLCRKHLLIVNNDVRLGPYGPRCQLCFSWPYILFVGRGGKTLNLTIIVRKVLPFFFIFGYILWILLYSDSLMSTMFLISLLTTYSHSSLDSFSFTSTPLNLRDSRRLNCSTWSIFLDFN